MGSNGSQNTSLVSNTLSSFRRYQPQFKLFQSGGGSGSSHCNSEAHIICLESSICQVVFNSYISKLDLRLHKILNPCVCLLGAFCQAPYSDEGSAPVPVGSDTVVQMCFFFLVSVQLRMEIRRGSNVIRYRLFLLAECGRAP